MMTGNYSELVKVNEIKILLNVVLQNGIDKL